MLTIPQLTEKMIAFSAGNTADIHHFLCVWAYAKTIGEAEGLDEKTLFLLEATAIIHDISCPLCREKYGNTDGKHQEAESPRLVRDFLADSGFDAELIDRISYLIAHHHTVTVARQFFCETRTEFLRKNSPVLRSKSETRSLASTAP